MKGLGISRNYTEFKDITTEVDGQRDPKEAFCDGTLRILNSNYREVAKVQFNDLFPTSLTSLTLMQPILMFSTLQQKTFKYTVYKITSSTK